MRPKKKFKKRGPLAMAAASWGLSFEQPECKPFYETGNAAVIEITGPLLQKGELFWDGYDLILDRFKAALESTKPTVLLKINSPGGDVAGLFECAREMRRLALESGKRVCSYADGLAASAAYAIACAAPGGIYVPQTGQAGSVGCIHVIADQVRMDRSMGLNFAVLSSGARKSDGNPHVEISDEARAAFQSQIDTLADLFFEWVSETRGLPVEAIRALEGGVFIGAKSVGVGLADSVVTFENLALGEPTQGEAMPKAQASAETEEKKEMSYEDALAVLKSRAEGDDEEAAKCRKALKAMEGDDEEKDKEKAEGDGEEKKDPPPPPSKDEAKALASVGPVLAELSSSVASMKAELTELKTRDERAQLLASRPDLMSFPKTKAWLESAPIAVVRDACKNLEKRTPNVAATSAAAASGATRGAGQVGDPASPPPSEDEEYINRRMGLSASKSGPEVKGNVVTFHTTSAAEAKSRAVAARNGGSK